MSHSRVLQILMLVALAGAAGWWGRGALAPHAPETTAPVAQDGPCPGGAQPLYWKAPMDPTFIRDEPGKSPMGMDLIPVCPSVAGTAPRGGVVIDPTTLQNIGVRSEPARRRDLARGVRAMGRVTYDDSRVAHVHTKVQGWVEELYVDSVGTRVERGQPLLSIYSPELVATQEELLLAARYRDTTTSSPFEDVREGGRSLFETTRRRLELQDVAKRDVERLLATGQAKRTLTLYAPTSGVVTELGVRAGMEVGSNENLYTIADLSSVWVVADVYEYELPWIQVGDVGRFELSYLPGEELRGTLTYVSPFLDPTTRTAEARLEVDNADGRLKPEMFGSVQIEGAPVRDVVALRSEAIIRSGARTLAVVDHGGGRFEPREVSLGLDSGDGWVEVRRGIEAGERVVLSSQFLIDSESRLREAASKLRAASAAKPAEAAAESAASGETDATAGDEAMRHPAPHAHPADHEHPPRSNPGD